jgi:LuxR family maltose regulon positive regulatory protein
LSIPLLLTKFNIPAAGAKIVHRPRLLRILDEALGSNISLILVCGPAGYGKTTLVSEWLQASQQVPPGQVAWLTLESGDDNLTCFLTYFVTALQHIRPGFGQGALRMLQTHRPQPPAILATMLINELSDIPGRIFLILDDYHLITAQPIQSFIDFLVDHQPPQLCLVLLTRTDPPLPLARLRARGQLVELRQSALCFLPGEVAEFTNQTMNLALSPEQVAFLAQHTEGWISGLQLAAISIRQGQDRSAFFDAFSGEHEFIADYLAEEVLGLIPEPVRLFLLHTSILERLTAPLCAVVTGQPGAQAMLQHLLDANLFILPLDERHVWFRYHVLFADLLRKRLHDMLGAGVGDLHRRAAGWFAENGLVDLAIEHAIAGADFAGATSLIEPVAESLLSRGQAVTLLRWLDALPQDALLARPVLVPLKAFALFMCGRPPQQVRDLIQELAAAGAQAEFQGELLTIQAMLAVMQGKPAEAIQLSDQAIHQLPVERAFFRSLAADCLGMGRTLAGDYEAAARAFEQVVELSMQTDNLMLTLMALSNLAGLRYVQGRLHAAIDTCRQVMELATRRIGRGTPMLGKTLFNLGEMLREQGDLDAALATLFEAASMLESFSEVGLSLAYLAIARIYLIKQDWPAAQSYIDRARQRALADQSTWMDERLVEVVQARYWIAHGDLDQAVQWARRRGILDRTPAEIFGDADRNASIRELLLGESLTLARLALAQRQPDRALEMLSFLQEQVEKRGHLRRIIEILALKALALQQKGDLDGALQVIGGALALAEPEGYQRAFVDEGEPMAHLLYQAVALGVSPAYAGKLLTALSGENQAVLPAKSSPDGGLIEPLSERELEVLQLIAEGLSNGEIAARLYISLSTVKGHTANIFGKLGVKNRTQAVSRARTLGLLPPFSAGKGQGDR